MGSFQNPRHLQKSLFWSCALFPLSSSSFLLLGLLAFSFTSHVTLCSWVFFGLLLFFKVLLSFPALWLSSPITAETLVCWFMFDIDLHPLPRGHEVTWDVMVGLWFHTGCYWSLWICIQALLFFKPLLRFGLCSLLSSVRFPLFRAGCFVAILLSYLYPCYQVIPQFYLGW